MEAGTSAVRAEGLVKRFGDVVALDGVDLEVPTGTVLGLLGPNGAGKSTLLDIVAGRVEPTSGRREAGSTARIGYYDQVGRQLDPGMRVRDAVTGGHREADWADAALLETFWFDDDAQWAPIGLLSGGERRRLQLLLVLSEHPNVLLLDEPTNDLDLDTLRQLEDFLDEWPGALVVVSHDRAFLERTVADVIVLEPVLGRTLLYRGGFDAWQAERAAAREAAAQEYADYASAHAALTTRARAARDTANRGASTARRKFAAGRVDKVTRDRMVDGATGGAQAARRIEAQAERLPPPEQPRRQWQLRLQFPALPDAPRVLASLDGVVVRAGSFTLGPVSATLHSRDRVLLSGANGAGKTLLLAILPGTQVADGGRVTALEGRLTAVLDQGRALPDSPTALAAARILLPLLTAEEVRTHLAKFGLDADDLGRSPSLLSWGERTRLQLAVAASRPTAALVLDEPTNHIDLPAIEQLEQALAAYPGAVVLVSHDARLRSTFRATSHWRLDAGQMVTETKED